MWSVEPDEELVYGILGESDEGVFVPEVEAQRLLALRRALQTAQTWGELRAAVDASDLEEIMERYSFDEDEDEDEDEDDEGEDKDDDEDGDDEERVAPADDAEFSASSIWGYEDGDWPDWPAARMDDWMPFELAEEYLVEIGTLLNGSYFAVENSRVDELVAELEELGHPCRRDDSLVAFISGYSVPGYSGT